MLDYRVLETLVSRLSSVADKTLSHLWIFKDSQREIIEKETEHFLEPELNSLKKQFNHETSF